MARRKDETRYRETSFGIIPRSKLIPLEVEGIKRAWDFVLQQRRKDKIAITADFLKEVHNVGFGWIFPGMGGTFRSVEVGVSHHHPPKPLLIAQLMLDFCRDLAERLKHLPSLDDDEFIEALVDLLSWAHHRFLWVHPFRDYNGRIGRLLINIILLNLDLPPIELKVETKTGRQRYVKALQAADRGNPTLLKIIFRDAIEEAAQMIK